MAMGLGDWLEGVYHLSTRRHRPTHLQTHKTPYMINNQWGGGPTDLGEAHEGLELADGDAVRRAVPPQVVVLAQAPVGRWVGGGGGD